MKWALCIVLCGTIQVFSYQLRQCHLLLVSVFVVASSWVLRLDTTNPVSSRISRIHYYNSLCVLQCVQKHLFLIESIYFLEYVVILINFFSQTITGEYPPETPYNPKCSPPPVRKRIGTSFSFSDIVNKSNAAEVRHFHLYSFPKVALIKKDILFNPRLRKRWHVHFPGMHCQCQLKVTE